MKIKLNKKELTNIITQNYAYERNAPGLTGTRTNGVKTNICKYLRVEDSTCIYLDLPSQRLDVTGLPGTIMLDMKFKGKINNNTTVSRLRKIDTKVPKCTARLFILVNK